MHGAALRRNSTRTALRHINVFPINHLWKITAIGRAACNSLLMVWKPNRSQTSSMTTPIRMNRVPLIMIVDDEPNVRLMFRTTLESAGYEVVEAEEGDAALDHLHRRPVDLILLDLRMPLTDGMETLRRLRDAGNITPVVIVTAHGSIPDAVAAVKLGAIDFVTKPLNPEALRRVVADVIDRHSQPPPGPLSEDPKPDSPKPRFAELLVRAKRALNHREFDDAEYFLDQAIADNPGSSEANHLREVLRLGRREQTGPYHMLRELFPVGRSRYRAP